MMKMEDYLAKLDDLRACGEAIKWTRKYKTPQAAWRYCNRGDWMLWLVGKHSGDSSSDERKKLVLCACKCARLALKRVAKGEKRPLKAIQAAEAWAKNKKGVSLKDVRAAAAAAAAAADADADAYAAYAAYAYAAYAAYAAAYAAYADAAYADDAAAYAAYADAAAAAYAYAAYAAYAVAYADDAAAYAAYADAAYADDAAAYAAYADAADADRTKILAKCADIVRKHYPKINDILEV